MEKVLVMLSTYNGCKYLSYQLDSILSQTDVVIDCLIRDDGSSDGTLDIISSYTKKYDNVKLIAGNNLGFKDSFMDLVYRAGDYDYYAFADQDDLWKPEKLSKAVEKLKVCSGPSMYFSNLTLVDNNLTLIGMLHGSGGRSIPKNEMSFFQGFAHGCTMVFNKASMDLIRMHKPSITVAHDYWIPLIHVYLGSIIYDSASYILYRQHSDNVFGAKNSFIQMLRSKLGMWKSQPYYYSTVIKELLRGYPNYLSSDSRKRLESIVRNSENILGKVKLLLNPYLRRKTVRGTLFLKLHITFGKF